jgi:hypothetical protein
MPYCATCRVRFHGSGYYCGLHRSSHRSRTREYYNYNIDSTNPTDIHFRTSLDTAGTVVARRRLQPDNSHDSSDRHALALYSQRHRPDTQMIDFPLAQTLAQSLVTLQDAHIITSLTYSVTPSGTQMLTAETNLEREQCPTCYTWFPNRAKLQVHMWDYPAGCDFHGICMPKEDVHSHGTSERHDRCFVRGCQSMFRKEGGWKTRAVEEHIRDWHY